jgi:5-methylcytosine-specific restriction endonuclease McrA
MKRGKGLRRTGPLRRLTPLRFRSPKTARVYREVRVPLVRDLLQEHPVCQRCSAARSTDVHEPKLRSRGGDPLVKAQCVALCRDCHDWVHQNPADATAEGWMKHSWEVA